MFWGFLEFDRYFLFFFPEKLSTCSYFYLTNIHQWIGYVACHVLFITFITYNFAKKKSFICVYVYLPRSVHISKRYPCFCFYYSNEITVQTHALLSNSISRNQSHLFVYAYLYHDSISTSYIYFIAFIARALLV